MAKGEFLGDSPSTCTKVEQPNVPLTDVEFPDVLILRSLQLTNHVIHDV